MVSARCGTTPSAPGALPAARVPLRSFAGAPEAEAALLELEDRRAFDPSILESAARSADPAVRVRAALSLGRLGGLPGRPLLVSPLSAPSPPLPAPDSFGSPA